MLKDVIKKEIKMLCNAKSKQTPSMWLRPMRIYICACLVPAYVFQSHTRETWSSYKFLSDSVTEALITLYTSENVSQNKQ